jgi:hypothetical protein
MFPPPTPTAGPTYPIAIDHAIVTTLVGVAVVGFVVALLMVVVLIALVSVRG